MKILPITQVRDRSFETSYRHVPVQLLKSLAACANAWLEHVAGKLNEAYASGIAGKEIQLVDSLMPDATFALGRAAIEAFAANERGFLGSHATCDQCGGTLNYEGDVPKQFKTRLGTVKAKRAYYRCADCVYSVCPLDACLGVDGPHAVTPSLQSLVGWLAASMSFPETVKVLDALCPSKFSLKGVETVTATVAREVVKMQESEMLSAFLNPGELPVLASNINPNVAVVEVDGGFVPVRDHHEPSREFKLAAVGLLQQTDSAGRDDSVISPDHNVKLVEKSFVGHFADPDTLFEHLMTEISRRGFHEFPILHCISDGGSWIMRRFPVLIEPGQTLSVVLDWWHADERLADAASDLYGPGTTAAKKWRHSARGYLWNGNLDCFFATLKRAVEEANEIGNVELGKRLQVHHDYFAARKAQLRYRECRESGLPIGSGAIEGGIRFIGKDRLNGTGMRWNIAGAEAILQLRCIKYSNRWEELIQKRERQRQKCYVKARAAWKNAA